MSLARLPERPGPVILEQSRQGAIGEDLATRLTFGAVVRFIGSVDDPLNRRPAHRAGAAVLAVNGHARAEGGDFFGEAVANLCAQLGEPSGQRPAGRREESHDLDALQFLGKRER